MGVLVDIIIAAIFAIALIIGAIKGFLKQISALRGLVAFVGAIILTAFIINLLQPTGLYHSFTDVTSGWFGDELLNVRISSHTQLALVLSEHGTLKILTGLSEVLFDDMQSISLATGTPCDTLAAFFGHYVANLILGFVMWLILLLLLLAIFKGIIKLMKNIIIMPTFKTVDRILGAIWSLALTYLILISLLFATAESLLIKFLPDTWATMRDFISNTTILLWLHDTNIIGELIAALFSTSIESIKV